MNYVHLSTWSNVFFGGQKGFTTPKREISSDLALVGNLSVILNTDIVIFNLCGCITHKNA